jgi:glycosyltransferase involved in cell wall biosynthesis
VDDIASGLEKIINDKTMREEMTRKGRAHASQFTSERMARQTMSVYSRFAK